MVSTKDRTQRRGRIPSAIFIAGIALLIVEACAYLVGIASPGILFVLGMVLTLIGALCSAFTDKGKTKAEDVITVFLGICFFAWIGWRSFMP
ncbi:hypothetical protein [Pseudomonas rhizophila]